MHSSTSGASAEIATEVYAWARGPRPSDDGSPNIVISPLCCAILLKYSCIFMHVSRLAVLISLPIWSSLKSTFSGIFSLTKDASSENSGHVKSTLPSLINLSLIALKSSTKYCAWPSIITSSPLSGPFKNCLYSSMVNPTPEAPAYLLSVMIPSNLKQTGIWYSLPSNFDASITPVK